VLRTSAYNCAIDRANDSQAVPVPVSGDERNGRPGNSVSIALAAIGCVAVIAACGSSGKPGGTSGSRDPALLEAQCMRSHGVPNFPDPTTSPPPAPPPGSHTGNAIGIGGAYLVIPPQSPALKRAAAACGFKLS
jgi:hypothetical protein